MQWYKYEEKEGVNERVQKAKQKGVDRKYRERRVGQRVFWVLLGCWFVLVL